METQSAFMAGAAAAVLLFAVLRDRRDRIALVFGALILSFAIWSVARGLEDLGVRGSSDVVIAGALLLGTLAPLTASLIAGPGTTLNPVRACLWAAPLLLGGVLMVLGINPQALRMGAWAWLLVGVFSGTAVLARFRHAPSGDESPDATRSRYVARAHAVVAVGAGIDLLAWQLAGPRIAGLLTPLLYFYAGYLHLLRVRVADLRQLVSNAITLTILAVTLGGAYASLWLWAGPRPDLFAFNAFVASFLLLLFLDPLRRRIQRSIERYYVGERLELERSFRPFSERITNVFTLDELLAELLEAVESSDRLRASAIFLREDPMVGFQQVGSIGLPPRRRVNLIRTPAWVTALEGGEPLVREELEKERAGTRRDDDIGRAAILLGTMDELHAQLVLPLLTEEHLVGFWTLTDERSTEPFSSSEIEFLGMVAEQMAVTIENSKTFERVRARDRFASLGEMAAGIAHEIRNPLATIRGAVAVLAESDGEPDPDLHGMIADEITRLDRVVDTILDYAKPSGERRVIRDVAEFTRRCVDAVARLHASESSTLSLDIAPDLPSMIANADQLERVIANVVENAFQALDGRGSIGIRIQRGQADADLDDCIEISVHDDGPGMDEVTLDRAFDPFFTTKQGGIGLGLALSERLVGALGGSIQLRSQPDSGTTVRIRLPCEDAAGSEDT
jgi:two-component system sensor histidine kinase HydH